MEFTSIEEIKEYFGIDANREEELRKELKIMISKLHPDKTGGEYRSKKQQNDYEELNQAIEFISGTSTELTVTRKEWSNMLQKVEELSNFKTKNDIVAEEELSTQLKKGIQTSVINFSKKHLSFKISSIAIATILTSLWAFPQLVESNKNFRKLVNSESFAFSLIWMCCIGVVTFFWIYIKIREKKDEILKKQYSLDSTQSAIFKLFLAWHRIIHSQDVEFERFPDDYYRHIYHFTKDDIVNFLLYYYDQLAREFESDLMNDENDLYNIVYAAYNKDKKQILEIPKHKKTSSLLIPYIIPGKMDFDLAQSITNALVGKLLNKKIITTGNKRTLSDSYVYIENK